MNSQIESYPGPPRKGKSSDDVEGEFEDDEFGDEAQLQRIKELNRDAFKSMMMFIAFLTIFTVVVVSNQSENTSRFVDQVRRKIQEGRVPLHTVTTIPTYWKYLEGTLMPAMYPNNSDTTMADDESQQLHPLDLSSSDGWDSNAPGQSDTEGRLPGREPISGVQDPLLSSVLSRTHREPGQLWSQENIQVG
jgi:hypothetical protein